MNDTENIDNRNLLKIPFKGKGELVKERNKYDKLRQETELNMKALAAQFKRDFCTQATSRERFPVRLVFASTTRLSAKESEIAAGAAVFKMLRWRNYTMNTEDNNKSNKYKGKYACSIDIASDECTAILSRYPEVTRRRIYEYHIAALRLCTLYKLYNRHYLLYKFYLEDIEALEKITGPVDSFSVF